MSIDAESCIDRDNCDLCYLIHVKYLEVLKTIDLIEQKINELRSGQPSKLLPEDIVSASLLSLPLMTVTRVMSKASPLINAISAIILASFIITFVAIDSRATNDLSEGELELLEEALKWFDKLREAYELMLDNCRKY
jgi:hypothetical protein